MDYFILSLIGREKGLKTQVYRVESERIVLGRQEAPTLQGANILIVDDDRIMLTLIAETLKQANYNILMAQSGEEALNSLNTTQPDIILLDVSLPGQDGYQICQQLKNNDRTASIPIIFISGNLSSNDVIKGFNVGAVDYVRKPICREELLSRVSVHLNNILLQKRCQFEAEARKQTEQALLSASKALEYANEKVQKAHDEFISEQRVARTIFDNIVHDGVLDNEHITYYISPLSIFNGDLLLAARNSEDEIHVMLGDFTGHGLPAAIGVMPIADIFYSMNERHKPPEQIIRQCNGKLKKILPVGMFCAASYLAINLKSLQYKIWAGGATDLIHINYQGTLKHRVRAKNVALGILNDGKFKPDFEEFKVNTGDYLYLYSDGVTEHKNIEGEMYGMDRLLNLLSGNNRNKELLDSVVIDVTEFCAHTGSLEDDLTIIEISC